MSLSLTKVFSKIQLSTDIQTLPCDIDIRSLFQHELKKSKKSSFPNFSQMLLALLLFDQSNGTAVLCTKAVSICRLSTVYPLAVFGQTPTPPVSAVARTDARDRGVVSFQHWMPGDVAILVNVICTHTRQKSSLYEWTSSVPTHGKKRRYTSERHLYTHTRLWCRLTSTCSKKTLV